MTITMEATVTAGPREWLSPELFAQLVARIVKDENVTASHAERMLEQALLFLKVCALNPGRPLAPSQAVDPAWHAFILHTHEYAAFCQHIAGRFIHHRPDRLSGEPTTPSNAVAATVLAMRQAGLPVDEELWTGSTAGCTPEQKCNRCTTRCHA